MKSTIIQPKYGNYLTIAPYIPTSHNTPVKTVLRSCRNLSNLDNYLIKLNVLNITDDDVFLLIILKIEQIIISCKFRRNK